MKLLFFGLKTKRIAYCACCLGFSTSIISINTLRLFEVLNGKKKKKKR